MHVSPWHLLRWEASDGTPLYVRWWEPTGPLRAHLLALHGIQSHGGWYEWSCGQLAAAGLGVHFLDRRGSGLNWSQRGDAANWRRLVADVVEYAAELRAHAAEPVFLWAGSWGAKIATAAALQLQTDLAGLALWCPGFFPKVQPALGDKLRIAWARVVAPERPFLIPLNDPALFTANPEKRFFISQDPLTLTHATARLLVESVRLDRWIRVHAPNIATPTLLLLAERDRIIDNARTRAFVSTWRSKPRIIEYPELEHTLEFEPRPQRFVSDLIEWLTAITAEIT